MLNKNEIAEFVPLITAFFVAALLLLFTQPQNSVASISQSPVYMSRTTGKNPTMLIKVK
jgi:hypothetical protein